MSASMDFSEVEKLSANIGRASTALVKEAHAVVAKGALNIKKDTIENISDSPSWRARKGKGVGLRQSVNYEQVGLTAEVGYDDVGQGELAGVYEFGSAYHDPNPTLYPAAERESPRFQKAMLAAAAKLIEDAL